MTKSKPPQKSSERPGRKTVSANPLLVAKISKEEERKLLLERAQRLADTQFVRPGEDEDALVRRVENLVTSLKRLAPCDEVEDMLASQMIAAHDAAMEAFRRAAIPEQYLEARDMNLKHAQKLAVLYVKQLEALDKHRGKGQQKITVEHVNVEAGGQAIVGNVTTGAKTSKTTARAVTHEPGETVPVIDADSAAESTPVPVMQSRTRKKV